MRVGIDLDDTIFNTNKQYKKYQDDYIKEKNITEQQLWSIREYRFDYIKRNLDIIFSDIGVKRGVKKTINYLRDNGHEIYIITARSKRYGEDIYNMTLDSLVKNNILFDKLILTEKYKLNACLENSIDIMIDNSFDVYEELKETNIRFILYDEDRKHMDIKNRASSWKEILELFIKNI